MAKSKKSRKSRRPRRRNPQMGYQVRTPNARRKRSRKSRRPRRRNPLQMGYQTRTSNPKCRSRKRNASSYAAAVRRGLVSARKSKGRRGNPLQMGYQTRIQNRRRRRVSRRRNPDMMGLLSLSAGGVVGFGLASLLGGLIQKYVPSSMANWSKPLASASAAALSAFLAPKVAPSGTTARRLTAALVVGMGIKAAADLLAALAGTAPSVLVRKITGLQAIGSAIPAAAALPGQTPVVAPGAATTPEQQVAEPAKKPTEEETREYLYAQGYPADAVDAYVSELKSKGELSGAYPPWSVGFPGYDNRAFPQLAENAPVMAGPPQMGYEQGMNGYYNYQPSVGGYYDYAPASLAGNPFGEPF